MSDIDMKQKIKEVRDKFLSNNQIEDIRQNITLGVEERLKFLNSEQIKVVELLEEKHKDLVNEIQLQSDRLNVERKAIEDLLNKKTTNLSNKVAEQGKIVENQNERFKKELIDQETKIKNEFELNLKNHINTLKSDVEKLSKDIEEKKIEIAQNHLTISKDVDQNNEKLKNLMDENTIEMEKTMISVKDTLAERERKITETIDERLSKYETDKKRFLQEASGKFSEMLLKLETKIESFIENHQMVEDIIDCRLTEFRDAQKAAFEELEAALNLLERHQDETITRFKNRSDLGISNHINLPVASKNRGSILHQPKDHQNDIIASVQTESSNHKKKPKPKRQLTSGKILILIISSMLLVYLFFYYLGFGYEKLLELGKSLFV